MNVHPVEQLLAWLPPADFAVLDHGLASHGRDYVVTVQDCLGRDPGTYRLEFTHCVYAQYTTRVRDDVWPVSWGDEFTNYESWLLAGQPGGYVWGTNWSNAHPGIQAVCESMIAAEWSTRIGKRMYEATIETERFLLRVVFHSIRWRKLSNETRPLSDTIIPLPPPAST
jgi:hypothetical protein